MNGKLLDTNVIIRYIKNEDGLKIKAQLKKDGHPIPENDMWIAACAMAYGLTVVTADNHFAFIKDLKIEKR